MGSLTVHGLHAGFTGVGVSGLGLLHGCLQFLVFSDVLGSLNNCGFLDTGNVGMAHESGIGFLSGYSVFTEASQLIHRDDGWWRVRFASILFA